MPASPTPSPWLSDLDPRSVEESLAIALASALGPVGADAAVVLLRSRAPARLFVRAPVGLDAKTIVAVGEFCALGPPRRSHDPGLSRFPQLTSTLTHDTDTLGP